MKQKRQLPVYFVNLMREKRKLLLLTQRDLAQKVGVTPTHLSLVENNIKRPSVRLVKKICAELDLSLPGYVEKNVNRIEKTDTYSATQLPYSYFGRMLLYHRSVKNLKLRDMALLCNSSETEILAIEENLITPKLETILCIIDSAQIDINQIIYTLGL